MIIRNPATGELVLNLSHDEFMEIYTYWQQKPETRAMFEKLATERKIWVDNLVKDIAARNR